MELRGLTDAELSAFLKMVQEARFPEVKDDPLVWISPPIILWHIEAVQEYVRRMVARGESVRHDRFVESLRWGARPERPGVLRRCRENPALRNQVVLEGAQMVRAILQPFMLDDAEVAQFVAAVATG